MAIAEPSPSTAPSPKQLGRQLRQVRKQKGLSRGEVARSAGLTRRELAAYERGKVAVPESDLWCLAGSCGVDVNELLPNRDPLQISSDLSSLTVGNSIRHLRATQERDGVLREYLSMIYELRNLPPGSRVPLREADLATLADALGGTPDLIEQRLMELIGASREEAARLRAMILPPLSLPAAGETASADHYAAHPQTFDPAAAAEQFFSTPRAEDPFAKPPGDDTLAPAPHIDAFFGGPTADPFAPADPFAELDADDPFGTGMLTPNPFADAPDLFAPPSGEPLSTAPPEADPFAALPADGVPEDREIANPFADLPEGMQIDDPLGTRGFAPDMRSTFAESELTMDPFGAAFEASVTPLDASDLLHRHESPGTEDAGTEDAGAADDGESPAESADGAEPTIGWVESTVESTGESTSESTGESMGESMTESTGESTVESAAEASGETVESVGEGWADLGPDTTSEPADAVADAMVEAMVDPTTDVTVESTGESMSESMSESAESTVESVFDASFDPADESPFAPASGLVYETTDPFGFASEVDAVDEAGCDTTTTDPFGFTERPAYDDAVTDSDAFASPEASPFGIAMPSIEDLLATGIEPDHAAAGFPAGDGWREAPAEPADPGFDSRFDGPFGATFDDGDEPVEPAAETVDTTDAFAALRNAFAIAEPAGDAEAGTERYVDEYGDPHSDLPEGMQVDFQDGDTADRARADEAALDAGAAWFTPYEEPPAESYVLETLPAELPETEEDAPAAAGGFVADADQGVIVDTGFDGALEHGFDTPATPVFDAATEAGTDGAVTAEPEAAPVPAPFVDDDLVPIAWTAHVPGTHAAHDEPEPEPVLEFVTAGPDWHVGGIYPATAGADGTLSMRRADVRWALADVTADGDCTIEAVVDFSSGAGFGVLFRASLDEAERLTSYSFDIEPAYGGGSYLVRQWVDSKQHWQPLAQAPVIDPAMLYGQRTLRLTLIGGQLTVTVDDDVVLHVEEIDQSSFDLGREPCRGDRVGVQAGSTTEVTVDTFRVAQR